VDDVPVVFEDCSAAAGFPLCCPGRASGAAGCRWLLAPRGAAPPVRIHLLHLTHHGAERLTVPLETVVHGN